MCASFAVLVCEKHGGRGRQREAEGKGGGGSAWLEEAAEGG